MRGIQESYRLALERVSAGDVTPMMLFPIGTFKSAKYPELPLTRELADEVIANFAGGILGTEPVVDSSGSHDTSAPAAAWVKRVYVAPTTDGGEAAFADVQWTDVGAQKVSAREYQYNSVELGPVVDNVTGAKTDNVLRSVTLTNTPVIRLLPKLLDAGDRIAEPVTVLLSEVTLATVTDPVQSILNDMDALAGKLDEALKGKRGMPAVRTLLREVRAKASAHALDEDPEDDGNPDVPTDASSEPASQDAKGDEGQPVTLAEGDAATKGSDQMKTVALKLNLAEDADEALVLAEVVKLSDERDAAVNKLAEVEKAKRDAEVERTLAELVDGGHVLPGQKAEWLKLAEEAPASFDSFAVNAKKVKAIELGETGSGSTGDPASDDPTVELDTSATKLAEERKVPYGDAMSMALAEDPALAARYNAREL